MMVEQKVRVEEKVSQKRKSWEDSRRRKMGLKHNSSIEKKTGRKMKM